MNINLKLQLCCFQKDALGVTFSSKKLGFGDHSYTAMTCKGLMEHKPKQIEGTVPSLTPSG